MNFLIFSVFFLRTYFGLLWNAFFTGTRCKCDISTLCRHFRERRTETESFFAAVVKSWEYLPKEVQILVKINTEEEDEGFLFCFENVFIQLFLSPKKLGGKKVKIAWSLCSFWPSVPLKNVRRHQFFNQFNGDCWKDQKEEEKFFCILVSCQCVSSVCKREMVMTSYVTIQINMWHIPVTL